MSAPAIKETAVSAKLSTPYSMPVGLKEKKLPFNVNVRYLYQPGKLEGGSKSATVLIWSLKVYTYTLEKAVTEPEESVLYYQWGETGYLTSKSCWLYRQIHSCCLLMLGEKSCCPSPSVALEARQSHIPLAVGFAITNPIYPELLLVSWRIGPTRQSCKSVF